MDANKCKKKLAANYTNEHEFVKVIEEVASARLGRGSHRLPDAFKTKLSRELNEIHESI
jgi:hypothetical protein